MYLLVGKGEATLRRYEHPHLGRLIQPREHSTPEATARRRVWAADNDAYTGFDADRFTRMLDTIAGLPGCRFVAAPDVVGDAAATLDLLADWRDTIRAAELPVALVAQDGLTVDGCPWDDIDALFVGGTTIWKLSTVAAELVAEANRRGLWTHMGRVNSRRRIRHARAIGCRSIDGTGFSLFTDDRLWWGLAECSGPQQLALEATS